MHIHMLYRIIIFENKFIFHKCEILQMGLKAYFIGLDEGFADRYLFTSAYLDVKILIL